MSTNLQMLISLQRKDKKSINPVLKNYNRPSEFAA